MNLQEFTCAVQAQFMDGNEMDLSPDDDFRNVDGFDSLTGMAILVMIQDNFQYNMNVTDFLKCKTPAELYSFIQSSIK